jgi:anti-sigma28 factor (negative regulator of flagellin synthesis)
VESSKIMRITDRYERLMERAGPGAARPVDRTEKTGAGGRTAAEPRTGSPLEVNVSARAQELAAGASRLQELKASIRDGSFKIDAHAIASRLVGED